MTEYADDPAAQRGGATELRLATAARDPVPTEEPGGQDLPRDRTQAILEAAKQVGALLKQRGHRFALAGSVAAYAHGTSAGLQHDADFCVRAEDAETVAATLRGGGLQVWTPPEDWLLKTECFGQDVDLIFRLAHRPVTTELLDRATEISVDSVRMPVLAPTDLVTSLLSAFSEHYCDFGSVLPVARALREKIDWQQVRRECGEEPMPAAFLFLVERLGVIAPQEERP
ncbi:nucleotidyltransferase family protein [Streptomyces sp. NPDC006458]|uniref:nucleotidyltransferase family protein n=1 Tax=Streptomyces sp. NPDC006458 TaxID=3154302 RepID=UPI0033B36A48